LKTKGIIGFDRRIQVEWLDKVAKWASEGLPLISIRERVYQALDGRVSGAVEDGALRKTFTVLVHVWVSVPEKVVPLRDEGILLLEKARGKERLAVHWGMCMATYPFFSEVARQVGRLSNLQERFTLEQVRRRVVEGWGDTERVRRSVRHIVQTLRDWGVLLSEEEKGTYSKNAPINIEITTLKAWLVEAQLLSNGAGAVPLKAILEGPALFPFRIGRITTKEIEQNQRLTTFRHALDEDMVSLRDRTIPRP
jgi:hypothetical protein